MARPFKSGQEKNVPLSVSVSPAVKKYFEENNISPTELFNELISKYLLNPDEVKKPVVVDADLKKREKIKLILESLRTLYVNKLKPDGDYLKKEKQFEMAVSHVMKEYPVLTKDAIYSFVERKSGYFALEEIKVDEE